MFAHVVYVAVPNGFYLHHAIVLSKGNVNWIGSLICSDTDMYYYFITKCTMKENDEIPSKLSTCSVPMLEL